MPLCIPQSRCRLLLYPGYARALLEQGEPDLTEDKGVVKVPCGNCGHVMLFDAEIVGIRGLWAEGRGV